MWDRHVGIYRNFFVFLIQKLVTFSGSTSELNRCSITAYKGNCQCLLLNVYFMKGIWNKLIYNLETEKPACFVCAFSVNSCFSYIDITLDLIVSDKEKHTFCAQYLVDAAFDEDQTMLATCLSYWSIGTILTLTLPSPYVGMGGSLTVTVA